MQAVILAGGKGTRLKPYTTTLPKPLVPVGEHPILEIMLRQLKAAGVERATIAVNHMADLIMAFFGDGRGLGLDLRYSREDKPLSTVGPIKLIPDLPPTFLVMNGDILTDLDFRALHEEHLRSGARLTIATYRRTVHIDFGVIEVDPERPVVTGFKEKPSTGFDVSMGIYVFSRDLLELVPGERPYGIDSLVLDMLARQEPIHVHRHEGYWLDIGRPDDYDQANQDVDRFRHLWEPTA